MSSDHIRRPERTLIMGCTAFAGFDSVKWEEQVIPNIPDYDLVVVSVPHITEEFLKSVTGEYLMGLRKAFVRFLHSGGKIVVLVSPTFSVKRPSKYPECVSNTDWCPITYVTPQEAGRSIVIKQNMYESYLGTLSEWSFYVAIPKGCLTKELADFYGSPDNTKYMIPLEAYLENRYGRVLAGRFHVEVTRERTEYNQWGNSQSVYPDDPDCITGSIVMLPLIGKASPEEALAKMLQEEVGLSLESPEPDWAKNIELPGLQDLVQQVLDANLRIDREYEIVRELEARIADIRSFRLLLYGTGSQLEAIVKRSLEQLGATVLLSRYSEEEYILEFEGQEFLVEVKGVAKSVALSHLRQLNDYLLKFQEDTGKECKGILFGNAWRNNPPDMRGTEDTQEFPDNVIRRAEQWGISLVSSAAFFRAFVKTLENPDLSRDLLVKITTSTGVVSF